MKLKYNITSDDGTRTSVVVYAEGRSYTATPEHPNFERICSLVENGTDNPQEVIEQFDVSLALKPIYEALSERVRINSGKVFFDGDEVHNALTETIVRFHASSGVDGASPVVNFMEKLSLNPIAHSKEQLFRWLERHNFGICPDGDFVAFKGVHREGSKSTSSGQAFVNGEFVRGQIPYPTHAVVEMRRSEVQHDPRNGCSTGLHVGTRSYASGYGSKLIMVKVNPRDVVSVPTDCNEQKMRVCRLKVLPEVQGDEQFAFIYTDPDKTAKVVMSAPKASTVAPVTEEASTVPKKGGKAKAKAKARGKAAAAVKLSKPVHKFPAYYEEFKKVDFLACNLDELRWLAREWGMNSIVVRLPKDALVAALCKEAPKRKRTW